MTKPLNLPNAFKTLSILVMLCGFLLPMVMALPLCNTEDVTETCQLETPAMTTPCSQYTYQVINTDGTIYLSGNLTLSNVNIYYFNITDSQIVTGTYIIRLCDNSTREMKMTAPITYIAEPSKAFVYEGLNVGSTAGILGLLFLFLLWVALIIFGIYAKNSGVGWVMTMAGIYGIAFAILLSLTFSIIFGGILALISVVLIIIGFM